MENGNSQPPLKAIEALERIEQSLYKLRSQNMLNSKDEEGVKYAVNLVKGKIVAKSKSMESKQEKYKAFLTECIVRKKLGPGTMLLCSVALSLKRVCELYHIGRQSLIELLDARELETKFLHAMVQRYQVPGPDFFKPPEMSHQPMQFSNTSSPGSELSVHLCEILAGVNADVNLTLPLDPRAIPSVALKMDLNDEVAWKIATLLSILG